MVLNALSIGGKIYSIALGMVALLIAVSAASLYMVDRVRDELQLQASIFLPLANRIASVETTVLDGEVLIERLRHAMDQGDVNATPEVLHKRLAQIGEEAHEQFQRAYALLESIDYDRLSKEGAVTAAQVEATLKSVESEYRDYQSKLDRMLDAQTQNASSDLALLNQMLMEDEQEIYHHLELVRARMQEHVLKAVDHIVELDLILNRLILVLTGLAVVLGLLLSALVTQRIVRPMKELVAGLKRVEDGDLDTELVVKTRDETAALSRGFNDMISGLRAKERITETFGKYVDARVVDGLIGNPTMTKPGGDRRHMTVLFTDMSGFTGLSEKLTPDMLVKLLNEYFEELSAPITNRDGVIDKYIGDAIMAYWGPPFVDPTHQEEWAVLAGLEQLEQLEVFREKVPEILGVKLSASMIDVHSGIASGPALVGTVGSHRHRNYTVMGDTVNLAARLEGACKAYKIRLLVDEATMKACPDVLFREVDFLRVKGRMEPVRAYEPMAKNPAPLKAANLVRQFEMALVAYRDRDFDGAMQHLEKCLEIEPEDPPTMVFLERTMALAANPPGPEWDGVWEMRSK